MSDRVAVFNEGVIQQIDRVDRLYEDPINRFVAGFVGDNTVLNGLAQAPDTLQLHQGPSLQGRAMGSCQPGAPMQASIRPERIELAAPNMSHNCLTVLLRDVIYFGDHLRLRCTLEGQAEISVKVPLHQSGQLLIGQNVRLHLPTQHLRLYP